VRARKPKAPPVGVLLGVLVDRGLYNDLDRVCRANGAPLSLAITRSRLQEIASARHAAWRYLAGLKSDIGERVYGERAIARLWGVGHTAVRAAIKAGQRKPAAPLALVKKSA
jgi:hypothetical protein